MSASIKNGESVPLPDALSAGTKYASTPSKLDFRTESGTLSL